MAALSLCCCTQAFPGFDEWGTSLVSVHRLLTAVDSLVAENGLWSTQASVVAALKLSSCGAWADLPCSMWNLLGPKIEPMTLP